MLRSSRAAARRLDGLIYRSLTTSQSPPSPEAGPTQDASRVQRLSKLAQSLAAKSGTTATRSTRLRGVGTWSDQLQRLHNEAPASSKHVDMPQRKKMSESFVSYALPFEDDQALHDQYVGGATSVRMGRLFEDLDSLAGAVSYRYILPDGAEISDARAAGVHLVTAAVDRIDLLRPLSTEPENMRLSGFVSHASRSSMEVQITLESVSRSRGPNPEPVLVGRFTMACRDSNTGKAHAIPQLDVEGEDEQAIYELGKEQKERKLAAQQHSLEVSPPNEAETKRLHYLFFDPAVLFKGAPPVNRVWMKDSGLAATIMMHPQERNVHGKIFGGYLMRLAYENAYATACLFARSPVTFLALDELAFKRPVAIGSLLRLTSTVTFAPLERGHRSFHVSVAASTTNLRSGEEMETNIFHFTFTAQEVLESYILPESYREAVVWLDAIRRRIVGLKLRHAYGLQS